MMWRKKLNPCSVGDVELRVIRMLLVMLKKIRIKRKLTTSGVALGGDVLTLLLEPNVDQLLIMGLVIVCGLFSHSL